MYPTNRADYPLEGGGYMLVDQGGPMNNKYHIYKNAPKCPDCKVPMAYLYTSVASNRTVWKCRRCNARQEVTHGYPDDEGDSSKRPMIFVSISTCEYFIVPGDNDGNKRIRKNYLRLQDKQTESSGRGCREQVSTFYALHI